MFSYGADGLRHRSAVNGLTTDFALDGDSVVREIRAGVNYATYLSGPTGPAYRRSDGEGTIRWYVYDGLGSVVGEVDPNGVMTARRGFDVYGATRSSSGTATSKHGFVGGLGHTTEDETGLIYMRARYYDPGVGRFVSEDPAGSGRNWFVYCDNDPVCSVDSSGEEGIRNYGKDIGLFIGNVLIALGMALIISGRRQMGKAAAEIAASGDLQLLSDVDPAAAPIAAEAAVAGSETGVSGVLQLVVGLNFLMLGEIMVYALDDWDIYDGTRDSIVGWLAGAGGESFARLSGAG